MKGGTVQLKLLHTNIRGLNSKKASLSNILNQARPDILTVNETALKGKNKPYVDGYFSFFKNHLTKSMGGVATAVENHLKPNTVIVTEEEGDDEYIIVRIDNCKHALNIVNVYGEQEGRTGREKVVEKWNRIRKDLDRIKMKGEFCLIVGDFNKKVGNDDLGVEGNHPEISFGGKLVRNLLGSGQYILVNNT